MVNLLREFLKEEEKLGWDFIASVVATTRKVENRCIGNLLSFRV